MHLFILFSIATVSQKSTFPLNKGLFAFYLLNFIMRSIRPFYSNKNLKC